MKVIALFLIIISICIGLAFSDNNTVKQSLESLSASNPNFKTITYPQYGFSMEIPKRFVYRELPYIPDLVEGFYDPAEKNKPTDLFFFESEEIFPPEKKVSSEDKLSGKIINHDLYVNKNGVEMYKSRLTIGDETIFYHHSVNVYYVDRGTDRVVSVSMFTEKEFSENQAEFDAIIDSIKTF